ncbi:putative major facilitator, sugar transporter, major facilitator superfamily [Septoria linicola]|nr:putative major facilitator, sugar transporter, major facilitator superfamily [Septoria linicola]
MAYQNHRHVDRIDQPFADLDVRQADAQADAFVEAYGLQKWRTVFVKAARILRDPEAWRSIDSIKSRSVGELTAFEADDLEREEVEIRDDKNGIAPWNVEFWSKRHNKSSSNMTGKSGFWHQPKELRTTIITLCVGAIVQGWNQTGSNGANLTWPLDLELDPGQFGCDPRGRAAWIFAIVNAAPWFSAAIFALLLSDPANELLFGRRAAIIVSAVFVLGASVGGGLVRTWQELLASRILLGIGMGCKASVVAVFAAEVAPARIRGSLVMNWQLFDALGIFLGFSANLMVSPLGSSSWRWMTASSAFPTIILLALAILACPESPRFLMGKGHYVEAYETLSRLRGSHILAAKEFLYTHFQMNVERTMSMSGADTADDESISHLATAARPNFFQKVWQLFTVPRIRNATLTAVTCMVSQQLCGVNVIIFYSSTLFATSSGAVCDPETSSLMGPLLMSWGIGLINFLFALPAYWLIDQKGRRWLLMTTLPFLFLFMGAAALSYANGSHNAVFGVFAYLFMAVYSVGMGPVPFTISAEVFPLDHRVAGMSFAVFTNLLGAGLLTLFVPAMTTSSLGHGGLLGISTFLNFVALVLVFCFVRETVGAADRDNPGSVTALALEELYRIFNVPVGGFLKYQVMEVVPYWRMRLVWLSSKRNDPSPRPPQPVYRWWEATRVTEMHHVATAVDDSDPEE